MPRAALRAVPDAKTLPLERITPHLVSLAMEPVEQRSRRGPQPGASEARP
jgi:hypothetical protein